VLAQLRERGRPLTAEALENHAAATGPQGEPPWGRGTWEQSRTALRYHLACSVREWAREADRARKRGDSDAARDARARAEAAGDGLAAVQEASGDHLQGKRTRSPARGLAAAQHQAEKRGAADWRTDLAASMNSATDRDLVRVLAATGARPAELAAGVELRLDDDGDLVARIQGAKVNGERGQGWRELTLDPEAETARDLVAAVRAAGGRATYRLDPNDDANNLRDRLAKRAKRLGYTGITAYSLRHQWASDAKARGVEVDALAAALGQRGTKSTQAYGRSRSGTGGSGILGVEAESDVRPTQPPAPWAEPGPEMRPG